MMFFVGAGASIIGISIYKSMERLMGRVDQTWPVSMVFFVIGVVLVYVGAPQ